MILDFAFQFSLVGSSVYEVTATDTDSVIDGNGVVSYSIISGVRSLAVILSNS